MTIATEQSERAGMTIDELARRAGITTRNVRAYQERGLLAAPERVGRAGQYDDSHLQRLTLISELLDRGYSLAAIGDLIGTWERGGHLGEVLGLEQVLERPWLDEAPITVTLEELAALFPGDVGGLQRAVDLGFIEPAGEVFLVPSPSLFGAGAELVRAGVPVEAVLDQAQALRADVQRIARRFVDLIDRHVFEPFVADGTPVDQLPRITDLVERMRPLAAQTVLPALMQAMERETAKKRRHSLADLVDDDEATP